jgi:3-phosphoshikimate 1-carboxyvinyltransferase
MHCGAGATTFRFLLAWACCQEGEERLITGSGRLLQRPHEDLATALRTLGADLERVPEGYRVKGRAMKGGAVHFDSPISSQYLSALLLIAPQLKDGLTLRWTGTRLSEPYVHMTLKIMGHFGVLPVLELDGVRVEPGPYTAASYVVPPDWSAAGFWYEAVALAPGSAVLLAGLDDDTLQGDRHARHLWAPWVTTRYTPDGAQLEHRSNEAMANTGPIDLRHYPDLFQPLVCTQAGLGVAGAFCGLENLRVKETDRLAAIKEALQAMGCTVSTTAGGFELEGQVEASATPTFDPRADHRMAMSLAPLSLVCGSVTLHDPEVVNKSYPGFWDHLKKVGFRIEPRS